MVSRRVGYAMLGGVLAMGAPAGLLAVRSLAAPDLTADRLAREVRDDAATFAYVTLSTLAAFVAFGCVLGAQVDRVEARARTDALTGILNRRAAQERLEEELARASRHGLPLSLLLIDVDGLKAINDRGGHHAGDRALCRTAAAMTAAARLDDVCGRWGGDEFVLLAPATRREDAVRLAERIRASAGGELDGGTVSIGVATFDGTGTRAAASALVNDADAALYQAKERGRNQVVAFSSEGDRPSHAVGGGPMA
jgi:diguanylate cyclase (GGDEF)-like protein